MELIKSPIIISAPIVAIGERGACVVVGVGFVVVGTVVTTVVGIVVGIVVGGGLLTVI